MSLLVGSSFFNVMEEPLIMSQRVSIALRDFYIDPRGQVERALVTHAHSDHARSGHKSYLV